MTTTATITQCEATIGLGSYQTPPERCEEDALPGSEHCSRHQEDDLYWDEQVDD